MGFLFKKKKKESAGLFIDKGLYRYIALKGHPGAYEVTRAFSGTLPATVGPDGEPYVDPGKSLNQALKLIRGDVGDLGTSVNLSLPTSDSLLRTVPLPSWKAWPTQMSGFAISVSVGILVVRAASWRALSMRRGMQSWSWMEICNIRPI